MIFEEKKSSGWGVSFTEINGILDDIAFQSEEAQSYIKEYGESIEELLQFEQPNFRRTYFMYLNAPAARLLPISVPLPDIIFKRSGQIPSIYFMIENWVKRLFASSIGRDIEKAPLMGALNLNFFSFPHHAFWQVC
ncbi:hypothetical protein ACIFQM_23190 [Paenibacillus sp. NRS-1782]|uniref:hypothetical protein n=1 Tax=unclassified Paenibacillus TaxID=185978 RepID=UPI003D2C88A8